MVDTLLKYKKKAKKSIVISTLGLEQRGHPLNYAVLTLHRPENVENHERLTEIMESINNIANKIPVVFPVHPRTYKKIKSLELQINQSLKNNQQIFLTEPLGYLDFLKLMMEAKLVLTDSGGVQEETTVLGVPCLTLRENTERPITVTEGTNLICGIDSDRIKEESFNILKGNVKKGKIPKYWDGQTAKRIAEILKKV